MKKETKKTTKKSKLLKLPDLKKVKKDPRGGYNYRPQPGGGF
jgi:hypothetical protein